MNWIQNQTFALQIHYNWAAYTNSSNLAIYTPKPLLLEKKNYLVVHSIVKTYFVFFLCPMCIRLHNVWQGIINPKRCVLCTLRKIIYPHSIWIHWSKAYFYMNLYRGGWWCAELNISLVLCLVEEMILMLL